MKPYYEDSHVTIYHKDCRDMSEVGRATIDLIATDPPFLVLFGTTEDKNQIGNYTMLEGWFNDLLHIWKPTMKPASNLILLCDWRTYPSFWRVAILNGIVPRNLVVWLLSLIHI